MARKIFLSCRLGHPRQDSSVISTNLSLNHFALAEVAPKEDRQNKTEFPVERGNTQKCEWGALSGKLELSHQAKKPWRFGYLRTGKVHKGTENSLVLV